VKISFGGASGIELAQACSTVDRLFAEYQAVVSAYSLKYVDFDIEGAATADPASFNRRSQAIARPRRNDRSWMVPPRPRRAIQDLFWSGMPRRGRTPGRAPEIPGQNGRRAPDVTRR
jgi:hypothetical protein